MGVTGGESCRSDDVHNVAGWQVTIGIIMFTFFKKASKKAGPQTQVPVTSHSPTLSHSPTRNMMTVDLLPTSRGIRRAATTWDGRVHSRPAWSRREKAVEL